MTLPVPRGWTRPARPHWALLALGVPFVVVFVVVGAVMVVTSDQRPMATAAMAFGVAGGAIMLPQFPGFGRGPVPVRPGALVLPMSRSRAACFAAIAVACVVMGWGLWAAGEAPVVSPVIGVVVGLFFLWMAAACLRGGLVVSPGGIDFAYLRRRRVEWDGVARVAATETSVRGTMLRYVVLGGMSIDVQPFAVDPLVLYWTLRYYAKHPESRAELADGRAVERIARGALTA